MSNYIFNNQVSANPINSNVGFNNSWIEVGNNAGRPLFAGASFITNFDDLTISLSSSDVRIGDIHIANPTNNLQADVADIGGGLGALRVLSQDLESNIDDITIGDKDGKNFASVYAPTSSLNVNVTNKIQISSVNISDANWLFQVGRGKVTGATLKSFTGYSSAIDGTFQPVWELGTYTFLTSAQQLRLWSTSASDTNVSVYIDGLDSNYNPINETLVLTNGTTGVLTVNSYYRINGISLTRTPMAVGQIDLGTSDKSNILANIQPDTDRSSMTVYSVPNGYTFFLERVNAYCNYTVNSLGNNAIPVNAYYRSYTINNGLGTIILQSPFYTSYTSTRISPRGYPQKTDCQWQCRADTGYNIAIGLQVEGILISNSAL